jgi:two-component system, sensor histidine kinase and response regulator
MTSQRAERALRESEAHYRSVVSVLSEGVFVFGPDGSVLSCNAAAERLTRLVASDVKGLASPKGWEALDDTGQRLRFRDLPIAMALAGKGPQNNVTVKARSPQGEIRYFEVSAVPVISADAGTLLSVVASFVDVTERKALDEELTRHRERLEDW